MLTKREDAQATPATLETFLNRQLRTEGLWMMSYAERLVLFSVLEMAKPRVAIEIGTAAGGSLQAIARSAGKVYSIDEHHEALIRTFSNVEKRTGDSKKELPKLLAEIEKRREDLGFVLVDGAHEEEGARADINNLLKYTPRVPLYILMHDSFNPGVRRAIRTAEWATNPHVHHVELDFIHGLAITHVAGYEKQMWGGLALAVLLPEPNKHPVRVEAMSEYTYSVVLEKTLADSGERQAAAKG